MADAQAPNTSPEAAGARSRGARTAARLRQAARDAFAEQGWHATRVEDIVSRAGVSHGTFYTYYDNKAAVLDALVRESQADLDALSSAAWEAGDVRANLERIIGGFLDVYARDRVIMRTWLQALNEEASFSDLYLELRTAFIRRVEENLSAAVAASGRTGGPPAGTVASTLVAMVEHFAYCWIVLGEPHDRDDAIAAIVLVWGSALNALANFEVVHLD